MAAKATRYGHLSGEEGYEFDGEKEFEFRKEMNETALSDTKKNVKPGSQFLSSRRLGKNHKPIR